MKLPRKIIIGRDIQLDKKIAAENLRQWFTSQGTMAVNLVSSPGSGKTSLLEATCRHWKDRFRVAVLVGDLATDRDAERLRPYVPVEQLTTGNACHLELTLVKHGLNKLPAQKFDFLFIENIGNLVCPASHDLAEHLRVVLLSTTEGDDKPGKYPKMFRSCEVMLLTKIDLLPHVPFDINRASLDARKIQHGIEVMSVCAIHDQGISSWCDFLERQRESMLEKRGS